MTRRVMTIVFEDTYADAAPADFDEDGDHFFGLHRADAIHFLRCDLINIKEVHVELLGSGKEVNDVAP